MLPLLRASHHGADTVFSGLSKLAEKLPDLAVRTNHQGSLLPHFVLLRTTLMPALATGKPEEPHPSAFRKRR